MNGQGGAIVKMPHLVLIDTMKCGEIRIGQQVVYRRGKGAVAGKAAGQALVGDGFLRAVDFAILATLRVPAQLLGLNPLFGIVHGLLR